MAKINKATIKNDMWEVAKKAKKAWVDKLSQFKDYMKWWLWDVMEAMPRRYNFAMDLDKKMWKLNIWGSRWKITQRATIASLMFLLAPITIWWSARILYDKYIKAKEEKVSIKINKYIIQKWDTVYTLCKKHHMSMEEFQDLNPDITDISNISIWQTVNVK